MRILSWNVRGYNAPDKTRLIKRCLDQVRPDILLLQETKIKEEDVNVFSRKFPAWKCILVGAQSASGGLAALWNDSVMDVVVIRSTRWWQWLKIQSFQFQTSFFLINIYGPNNSNLKMQMWEELADIMRNDRENLFILGGDFNAILRPLDKMGSVGWNRQSQRDLSSFVMNLGLIEIPFRTWDFTWTNRSSGFLNMAKRLDRFFIAGDWLESHWKSVAEILPISGSHHYPICLRIQEESAPERCSFKFETMWLRDSNIRKLIEQWWKHNLDNPELKQINREAVNHFSDIFNGVGNQGRDMHQVLGVIPACVKDEHNQRLMEPVSMEEVKLVVFGLGSDKSPGPNDFPALFFQKFWDILAKDILGVVEESRAGGFVLRDFNNTFIALIPKKAEITSFDDFYPISLCNTIYKIISKVMANRLKQILDLVISSEQSGFAPGKSIYEGIILAHEVIYSIQIART
ncbi:uncharacterized protein LOC131064586 [Cryptomeria japonica]|uniref:uncharacterized protein LOC131064586 n=1 Tax=Cryptomeria japonica TaxID=3369 RepID=UPI0027DA2749|nr:uncharacterized protein LOC131064586 [Cryptomeria japonica]